MASNRSLWNFGDLPNWKECHWRGYTSFVEMAIKNEGKSDTTQIRSVQIKWIAEPTKTNNEQGHQDLA